MREGLNTAQIEVLRWVAEGCPEGRYEDYSHRVSAAALRTRGLLRISGHGSTWHAELTDLGAAVAGLAGPAPPQPAAETSETSSTSTGPSGRRAQRAKGDRPPSKTEQLLTAVVAAGGVLRVPYWREEGQPDYRARAYAALRFGKAPSGKRLVLERVGGEQLEIRLEDEPPDAAGGLLSVPVPTRLTRPHPAAARYRDNASDHFVSRAMLARSVRIIHALAVEAERRGHKAAEPNLPAYGRGYRRSEKELVPHIVLTVGSHGYSVAISEEKVGRRGAWEERKRRAEEHQRLYPYYGSNARITPYDSNATGSLTISLVASGPKREGRQASWSDRKTWRLEEKLPELLRELELRSVEDDEREGEERRQAEQRERLWQQQIEQAKQQHVEAHRAKSLRAQIAAHNEAESMRSYLTELEAAYGDEPVTAEWIEWIRDYVARLDPLSGPPAMPEAKEPSSEELEAFLPPGVSRYGPRSWS